jgi:hypothetical protein
MTGKTSAYRIPPWLWVIALLAFVRMAITIGLMGEHDYRLVASGGKPRFTYDELYFPDGGSVEYCGFGYRVTAMHRLVPFFHATGEETGNLVRVGPQLRYWIPVFGRDGTTTNFIPHPRHDNAASYEGSSGKS